MVTHQEHACQGYLIPLELPEVGGGDARLFRDMDFPECPDAPPKRDERAPDDLQDSLPRNVSAAVGLVMMWSL